MIECVSFSQNCFFFCFLGASKAPSPPPFPFRCKESQISLSCFPLSLDHPFSSHAFILIFVSVIYLLIIDQRFAPASLSSVGLSSVIGVKCVPITRVSQTPVFQLTVPTYVACFLRYVLATPTSGIQSENVPAWCSHPHLFRVEYYYVGRQ